MLRTGLVILLYFVAYAFYSSQQVVDINTLFSNFMASFTPIALLNIAILIIALFILYAMLLRVSWRQLLAPLACILFPLCLATVAFTFLYVRWLVAGDPTTDWDIIARLAAYWVMFTSLAGFAYILYRAVKTRLNAYLMHPVLTPLIELTLAAQALDVALQGKATVLTLPYVSSRLLVVALPAILVIYYVRQTLIAHRDFLADHKNTVARQLVWCGEQIRTKGLIGLWRASGTATVRLGIALLLLLVATILFPARFTNTDTLNQTQIDQAIKAGETQ